MFDLVHSIEAVALVCRAAPPTVGLQVDQPGVGIALPLERPLFDACPVARVESLLDPDTDAEVDVSALFGQTFVDQARLADKSARRSLSGARRCSATLSASTRSSMVLPRSSATSR